MLHDAAFIESSSPVHRRLCRLSSGLAIIDGVNLTSLTAILASAVAYGWKHVEDANASDGERIGYTPQSFAESYSVPVRVTLTGLRGH